MRLFSGLSQEELSRIDSHLGKCIFLSNSIILSREEPAYFLYFIISGRVCVELRDRADQVFTIAEFGPGELFGERAIITNEPRTADVRAVSREVVTARLHRNDFQGLLAGIPALYANLCRELAMQLGSWAQRHRQEESEHREVVTNVLGWQLLPEFSAFPGSSTWVKNLNRRLKSLATSPRHLLILGEPGTWKDLAARLVHYHGDFSRPVLFLDCAAPPPLASQIDQAKQKISDSDLLGVSQAAALFGNTSAATSAGMVRRGMLELATGGDIILRNVDCLQSTVQTRLLSFLENASKRSGAVGGFSNTTARIIATSGEPLEHITANGGFNKALLATLSQETIVMSPLRDRKRDIPIIARSLLRTLNAKYHKNVAGLSQDAHNRLVDHDWPLNGTELYQVLSRAVLVCTGDKLLSEHIFLQGRQFSSGRFNLFNIPVVERLARRPDFPVMLRWTTVPLFLLVFLGALFGPQSGNAANLAVWTLWWPALLLTGFLFARGWCSYCPLQALAEFSGSGRRLLHDPALWLRKYGPAVSLSLFAGIFVMEQATGMFSFAFATGIMLLTLLAGTISGDLFLGRRGWCKHLCPLGRIVSLTSRISIMEMHSNHTVCASRCRVDECIKEKGCPMGLHPSGLDNSDHCVLCLDCVRNCPHHSMQLDLRNPAEGLLNHGRSGFSEALFSVSLIGLIMAAKVTPYIFAQQSHSSVWSVGETLTALLISGSFTLLALVCSLGLSRQRWKASFAICGTAYIPLALTGLFVLYFREFVNKGADLVTLALRGINLAELADSGLLTPDLGTLRLLIYPLIIAGCIFSWVALSRLKREYNLNWLSYAGHRLLLIIATIMFICLL